VDSPVLRYSVYTAEGGKCRTVVHGKTREEVRRKLTKTTADRDDGLVYTGGHQASKGNRKPTVGPG
jgi:hypothetical protein